MIPAEGTHKLTQDEKMVYGDCPVCDAKHGERCRSEVGIALGLTPSGQRPTDGAHLARLNRAPRAVKVVAIR